MAVASMERAGSIFKKWFYSLPCISPVCEERAPTYPNGAEREMEICHQQPHLVPPMRLVVYDELPSPGGIKQPSRASRLVQEGKGFASKTTDRAMRSIKTRSSWHSRQRPSISAPSDFKHLNHTARRVERFRPLELSIHLPGNRLPDLPEFDSFDLGHPEWLTPPPKVLPSPFGSTFERHSDSPVYKIPRKPLNSEHYPSLSTSSTLAPDRRRKTLPEPIIRTAGKGDWMNSGTQDRPKGEQSSSSQMLIPEEPNAPSPQQNVDAEESFLGSPIKEQHQLNGNAGNLTPPLQPPAASQSTPPRSRRVAQWLLSNSSATPSPVQANFQANNPLHSRSRTLSGSTLSSANAAASGRTASLTSTAATLYQPPSLPAVLDKELESSPFTTPCPTVYEGKQQQYVKAKPVYRENQRHGAGDIGLAF